MSHSAAARPERKRKSWLLRTLLAALILFVVYLGATSAKIVRQSGIDETRQADAIVVFGAAEYAGHPSPVLRARLEHAFDLFQHGVAPLVITTGGAGADPTYTEGGVSRDYLIRRGIPDSNLIAETQSEDSAEAAERVGIILRANGMRTCVVVSDAYHIFRIKRLLEAEGATVYGAPRPGSLPRTAFGRATAVLREALSYTFWKMHIT